MNDTISTAPYSLDVTPSPNSDGTFRWTIRKDGSLFQRSDRGYRSENDARKNGLETIERLLTDFGRPQR